MKITLKWAKTRRGHKPFEVKRLEQFARLTWQYWNQYHTFMSVPRAITELVAARRILFSAKAQQRLDKGKMKLRVQAWVKRKADAYPRRAVTVR